jgi:hypothetical protein
MEILKQIEEKVAEFDRMNMIPKVVIISEEMENDLYDYCNDFTCKIPNGTLLKTLNIYGYELEVYTRGRDNTISVYGEPKPFLTHESENNTN